MGQGAKTTPAPPIEHTRNARTREASLTSLIRFTAAAVTGSFVWLESIAEINTYRPSTQRIGGVIAGDDTQRIQW